MKGRVLRISSLTMTYDGQSICMGFPSSFSNDIVQIQYNSMGGTLQNGREGKALHVMHITLPNNVQIQINRWNEAMIEAVLQDAIAQSRNLRLLGSLPHEKYNSGQNEDLKECELCLEEYQVADELLRLPCMHFFHINCITPWLESHSIVLFVRLMLARPQKPTEAV